MGENTGVDWAHFTFNPWIGCSRVSPACADCYAAAEQKRYRDPATAVDLWRRHGERRVTSDAYWRKPARWDAAAAAGSGLYRTFAASWADVFENRPDLIAPRARLAGVIGATPHLRWMMLTKRIGDVPALAPWGDDWPDNVWLGTSVESQDYTWRVDMLRQVPARTRFLSVEPMLGPVQLNLEGIHWVIVGGMSGRRHARHPLQADWARSVRDQCAEAGVAFYFKQWGGLRAKDGGKILDGREWCEFPDDPARLAAA